MPTEASASPTPSTHVASLRQLSHCRTHSRVCRAATKTPTLRCGARSPRATTSPTNAPDAINALIALPRVVDLGIGARGTLNTTRGSQIAA